MISINSVKNGMTIIIDRVLFSVVWFQHVKPGKGGAFVKTKLKNIMSGAVIDRTFRAAESVEQAFLDQKKMEYLYKDGNTYWFMDTTTYEQTPLSKDILGDNINYLKENMRVDVDFYEGRVVGIELPIFVELKVEETVPGVKGNTVSGGSKRATMETGAVIQVPLFIKNEEILKIDTRTGEYMGRA